MPGPYFQRLCWTPYVHRGVACPLDHLDEYEFEIDDAGNVRRRIAVTFSDHVFTRDAIPTDDPREAYPGSTRDPPGHFCETRYAHSLNIRALIDWGTRGHAWNLDGEHYAQVPTVDHNGRPTFYAIVFSLDPVGGLPVHLHMRVRSAYPCDQSVPTTFGSIKFKKLVELRAERRRPKKITDRGRKKPSIQMARPH